MTSPKPSRADDIAMVRETLNYLCDFQKALDSLDRLASEPSPDAIRDAALEEAVMFLHKLGRTSLAIDMKRALKSQPAKET